MRRPVFINPALMLLKKHLNPSLNCRLLIVNLHNKWARSRLNLLQHHNIATLKSEVYVKDHDSCGS